MNADTDFAQLAALGAALRLRAAAVPAPEFPVTLDGPLSATLTTTQAARLRERIRAEVRRFLEEEGVTL